MDCQLAILCGKVCNRDVIYRPRNGPDVGRSEGISLRGAVDSIPLYESGEVGPNPTGATFGTGFAEYRL